MQEQLISFETAKLAKEKGFDLLSNNFYCENYEGLRHRKCRGVIKIQEKRFKIII